MDPFATVTDVENRWRPLTPAEQTVAATLIDDASDMIRVRWSDIDSRVLAGNPSESTLTRVVAGMVRRAMLNRDSEGLIQFQETTGPFSAGGTYSNPNNNLYLSADDILALEPFGYVGRSRMGWLV